MRREQTQSWSTADGEKFNGEVLQMYSSKQHWGILLLFFPKNVMCFALTTVELLIQSFFITGQLFPYSFHLVSSLSEILSNLKNDYICMLNVKEGHFSFDLNVTKEYGTRTAKKSLHFGGLICFPLVIDFCQVALYCSVTKS